MKTSAKTLTCSGFQPLKGKHSRPDFLYALRAVWEVPVSTPLRKQRPFRHAPKRGVFVAYFSFNPSKETTAVPTPISGDLVVTIDGCFNPSKETTAVPTRPLLLALVARPCVSTPLRKQRPFRLKHCKKGSWPPACFNPSKETTAVPTSLIFVSMVTQLWFQPL